MHAIHPHDDEYHYTIRGQVRERPKGITLKDLPPKDDLEGVAEVPISPGTLLRTSRGWGPMAGSKPLILVNGPTNAYK